MEILINTTMENLENKSTNSRPFEPVGKNGNALKNLSTPSKTRPNTCEGLSSKKKAPLTPHSPALSTSTIGSVSREAARLSKIQNTADRVRKVAELKDKWAQEKHRKTLFHKTQRTKELQRIQEVSKAAAAARKRCSQIAKKIDIEQKKILQEQLSASLQDRALLAQDVDRMVKERRRQSVLINTDILRKAKEKEAQILEKKRLEDEELHEAKRLDALAIREAKMAEDINRRQSLVNRGEAFRRQRMAEEERLQNLSLEEHQRIEFRYESWKADNVAKEAAAQRSRESMAGRLDTWRMEKAALTEIERQLVDQAAQDEELRRQDWLDTQNYKMSLEKASRESLAGRLDAWRSEKTYEQKVLSEQEEASQIEYQLKQQAADDLKAYQESIRKSKRESLAYRLDKAREDKSFEQGQASMKMAIEAEERRIAELDRLDVTNYRQNIRAAARQSLEYRNQTEFQERMRLKGEIEVKRVQDEADRELKDLDWRAVQEYRELEREKERREMAVRLVENRKQHEKELTLHREALDKMHNDLELKHLAWQDVNAAREADKQRSRKSIAFRLESWRQQRVAEEMLSAKKELQAEEDAMLREQDREALAEAKEMAKKAEILEFTNTRMMT